MSLDEHYVYDMIRQERCQTCGGDGVVLTDGDEHDCRDHYNDDGCFTECPECEGK